jgi:hypothetical protein
MSERSTSWRTRQRSAAALTDTCFRCEKLQAACDEAASSSERHQAALAKQMEVNKVLDNDLKMMCVCVLPPARCCLLYDTQLVGTANTRKTRRIWRTSTNETTTAAATRARALACVYDGCTTHRCHSYAISRLDRCEGLLQEWGTYVQSAAVTARAMDEVCSTTPELIQATHSMVCIRSPRSTRRARRWSPASWPRRCSALAASTP